MMSTIKLGLKKKHLIVPTGWYVVKSGSPRREDMFANLETFHWQPVGREDLDLAMRAEEYECLIRKTT